MQIPTLTDDDLNMLDLHMTFIEDVLARAFAPHEALAVQPDGEVVEPGFFIAAMSALGTRLDNAGRRAHRWATEAGG